MPDIDQIAESHSDPVNPSGERRFKAFFDSLEARSQLVSSIASFVTVLLLSMGTYFTAVQTRQSAEQYQASAKSMATQIDQAAFAVNYQEFTHCLEQLENALADVRHQQTYSSYEPVAIVSHGDSLVLRLVDGDESPVVVDESLGEPVIRIQRRGAIAVCLPVGDSETVFQVASKPERLLSYFQRAKMLEERLGDAVVASQYLTLARFALAYSGFDEAENFLRQAIACTERTADGPGKAMMLGQVAAMRVKYKKDEMTDEGRRLFREAVASFRGGHDGANTVSLVNVYQAWAEAEYRAENIGQARNITQLLFDAIDRLPVKQTIKNQYVVDAATAILIEMEMAAHTGAELPVPKALRFPTESGEWRPLTASALKNGLSSFRHARIPIVGGAGEPAPTLVGQDFGGLD